MLGFFSYSFVPNSSSPKSTDDRFRIHRSGSPKFPSLTSLIHEWSPLTPLQPLSALAAPLDLPRALADTLDRPWTGAPAIAGGYTVSSRSGISGVPSSAISACSASRLLNVPPLTHPLVGDIVVSPIGLYWTSGFSRMYSGGPYANNCCVMRGARQQHREVGGETNKR